MIKKGETSPVWKNNRHLIKNIDSIIDRVNVIF
jgi:hypothetical protein